MEKKKKEKRLLSETKRHIAERACPDCGGDVITTVEIVHSEPGIPEHIIGDAESPITELNAVE